MRSNLPGCRPICAEVSARWAAFVQHGVAGNQCPGLIDRFGAPVAVKVGGRESRIDGIDLKERFP